MSATRIVVFAKAPRPGEVKTRLIPALGARGAAALAANMLAHTLAMAAGAGLGEVELCASPPPDDAAWQGVALPTAVRRTAQGEGDLGARMAGAARRVLAAGERVLLIGTDCPGLDADVLGAAARALDEAEAVLVPSCDGGYVLLGLRRFDPTLFADIAWSTPSVAEVTRARLSALGWPCRTLPALRDIDLPEDLAHLPAGGWLGAG